MAAPDGVMAGYAAIPVVQGATAVQGGRIAQTLEAPGLSEVASVPVKLRFDLEAKNGVRPCLCGNNHVIWHDGEPVDPFVLSVWADDGRLALRREVFNQGKSLLAMTPLERAFSARWPIAREAGSAHIPEWALPKEVAATFDDNA